jgi:RNA polymerase sigma factor (sigma-70 family)
MWKAPSWFRRNGLERVRDLVIRARNGSLEAYAKLIRQFQDMAYGYAYAVLGDFHLAEDVTQEAFVAAFLLLKQLREPGAFAGWLRRIVAKHCDRQTRRKQVHTLPLDVAYSLKSHSAEPPDAVAEQSLRQQVFEAIAALPEAERKYITLFYINGYSHMEIARFLGCPVATVKNRLRASRNRLRERMVSMVDKTLRSVSLPDEFADVIVRKVASEMDLKDAAKFLSSGYHGKRQPGNFKSVDSARRANIYVVGEEGKAQSAGYYDEIDWSIGSTLLRAVRPHEMAGEGEGVPSPIFYKGFQGCFKMAKENGCAITVVHGSQYDHSFCGFVPSFYYAVATLPCSRAKSITTSASIREARNQKESKAGHRAFMRDPYATKLNAFLGGGEMHIVEESGKIVGYFCADPKAHIRAKKYGMQFGYVSNITLRTRESALTVIKLASELAEKSGEQEVHILESHMTVITQTILRLGGRYFLRPACDVVALDAEMAAIIDLLLLSQNLQSEFQSRLNASLAHAVDGEFSIESCGSTIGFVIRSGSVEIVSEKQKVHRVLPRWVVTRLYSGYYSGEDVLSMGPVPFDRSDGKSPDNRSLDMKNLRLPEAESALFKALFPKLWPCATPDPDVWPWVMSKKHPQYRYGDNEPVERRTWIDALKLPWIGY